MLAVSDEEVVSLTAGTCRLQPDVILGAGDLPAGYLEALVDRYSVPLVYVPGNHDPDMSGYRWTARGFVRAGMPAEPPGPRGGISADGAVVRVAGLTVAGLGGCIRYSGGPNQWTEAAQARRAWRLRARAARRGPVDVVLTHAPAAGVGDGPDAPHLGFACVGKLVARLRPQVFVHGHVHPHGRRPADLAVPVPGGEVPVLNTVGYTYFDVTPGGDTSGVSVQERRYGA
ncbi:metallophosphoesterase [Tsukamurella sp. 8F]|uniref:metallophosphoesterase family protein n=1 Tax=unclassified Tsukamurella TaxID=2633480 RepID=UPI0023B92E71|nr:MULTISPECIES: metallophosphoesterase [unclassified Tsukamurella]MDF0530351.1 metallophosphoesterase [Tsukamurella sp. 8J]MDF0587648.1 metallophosphoesterase [Tsukamurella sp. 8F]